MESESVNMESRGKLGNDERVKFVEPRKNVRWREKTCGSRDICKLHKNHYFPNFLILCHFPLATKQAINVFLCSNTIFTSGLSKEQKQGTFYLCFVFNYIIIIIKSFILSDKKKYSLPSPSLSLLLLLGKMTNKYLQMYKRTSKELKLLKVQVRNNEFQKDN